jgi:Fe-S-cluster containining protein
MSCGMCGKCCEVICIPASHTQWRVWGNNWKDWVSQTQWKAGDKIPEWENGLLRDDLFISQCWHPMTFEEASEINPAYALRTQDFKDRALYSCDQYDADLKLCGAHENQPSVCSRFPFYRRESSEDSYLPYELDCSYWADIPQARWKEGVNPMPIATYIPLPMA